VVVRGIGLAGPGADGDLSRIGVEPRRLDRSARWLTAAAALALGNTGHPLRGEAMARSGLFVGAARMPEESSRRCHESIRRNGIAGTSAAAFARMSVNAPAGACSRALGLLGPTTTVSSGDGSGLLAAILAADWLAHRDDADCIVAGGVDERRPGRDEGEGAACVLLERVPAPDGDAVIAAGWGIAGRDGLDAARERAMGGRAHVDVVIDVSDSGPPSEALRSAVALVKAVERLRAGTARSILVVASRGTSSLALLLERRAP
jgi:3-oxoacyl-[acyl-carrier-protein] synthase II